MRGNAPTISHLEGRPIAGRRTAAAPCETHLSIRAELA
jgi:hypothetical protein